MRIVGSRIADILAVVVLYKRLPSKSETLVSLNMNSQLAEIQLDVVVYDNSPSPSVHSGSELSFFPNLNIDYIHDSDNPGLSRAYNVGMRRAIESKKRWLMIFDQDSQLNNCFLEKTVRSLDQFPDIDLHLPIVRSLGNIVSPVRLICGRSVGHKILRQRVNGPCEFFAINSGTMIRLDYLTEIGGYDERFKLHLTDNWFCDLYTRNGKQFAVTEAYIDHDLSRDTSEDRNQLLNLYKVGLQGYQILYSQQLLHRIVLFTFSFLGATKLSLRYHDFSFLKTFFDVILEK